MTLTYDSVKPWGRLFNEYVSIFSLTEADLAGRILGCADGPASFNAEATAKGYSVVSVDPIYGMTASVIQQRVDETWQDILEQVSSNLEQFVWTKFRIPEEVGQSRLGAMRKFIADFEQGKREGRYIEAGLPVLPFPETSFDLALCSHFLFLYSDHFSTEFHIDAVREMCRVAREVRIYPLLDLTNQESVHVEPVIHAMKKVGWSAERVLVDYEFLRGANQMLRVYHKQAHAK
jgi:hypothetical protein